MGCATSKFASDGIEIGTEKGISVSDSEAENAGTKKSVDDQSTKMLRRLNSSKKILSKKGSFGFKKERRGKDRRVRKVHQHSSTYDDVHILVQTEYVGRNRGLVGLKNLGNTCFMSAALQCLSNIGPLADYFLGYDFKKEINRENIHGFKGTIAKAFGEMIETMWSGVEGEIPIISPKRFKTAVDLAMDHFQDYGQHDVQEYFAFLLDAIHEDLNRVLDAGTIHSKSKIWGKDKELDEANQELIAREAWRGYLSRNKSIIVDLFQGQLRSTLQCGKCGHKSIKFDPFMYLSLPIPKEIIGSLPKNCPYLTLDHCLKRFCEVEELDGEDGWYCPECKIKTNATKKLDLWKLPPVLIIHLKRFESSPEILTKSGRQGRHKISDFVIFPTDRMVLDWVVDHGSPQRDHPDYDLMAVANHHGSIWNGHYTSFARSRSTNDWNQFDDEEVIPVSPARVVSSSAYVLMYVKMEDQDANEPFFAEGDRNQREKTNSIDSLEDVVGVAQITSEMSASQRNVGLIRRQSCTKPHLWPHAWISSHADKDSKRVSVLDEISE
mmetsp:Transcript_4810/g.7278  ORF Transcript_4810/g.7278 Transcript_4810/m.7278 type:complete len:551 (-) Transcript_4810:40-1692(-)